jgi:hypothetical protein
VFLLGKQICGLKCLGVREGVAARGMDGWVGSSMYNLEEAGSQFVAPHEGKDENVARFRVGCRKQIGML